MKFDAAAILSEPLVLSTRAHWLLWMDGSQAEYLEHLAGCGVCRAEEAANGGKAVG